MKIVKNSGSVEDFDKQKLRFSLFKSGATELQIESILQTIENKLFDGIKTKQIYKLAYSLLKKHSNYNAARYNLKEAIRMLGPAGFFFEKYVARIFTSENYLTQSNLTLMGKCVSHEIDILIKKRDQIEMIECKFHLGKDVHSDVKVPMYILSRFNDLKDKKHTIFSGSETISNCWIVTNNRFTTDAITFGTCVGLKMMSWNFPENNCLKTKNDTNQLYPITCLTTLSGFEKEKLLILDCILVKDIIENELDLKKIGLSENRIKNVLKEAVALCR